MSTPFAIERFAPPFHVNTPDPEPSDDVPDRDDDPRSNEPRPAVATPVFDAAEHAERLARELAEARMPRDRPSSCSHRVTFPSEGAARGAYGRALDALLDVNHWSDGLSAASADFMLFDGEGRPVGDRRAQVGDFIRVDLPGPLPHAWVRIEAASIGEDRAELRVRPTYDPTERPVRPDVTAHFFDSQATNTFTLERRGDRLRLSVEGRHETPNVGPEAGSGFDALVNRQTTIGSFLGMQHRQWDELTASILEGAR